MKIIGISGLGGSGKDLSKEYIADKLSHHGKVETLRMAQPLKEACGLWFGWDVDRLTNDRHYKESSLLDNGQIDPICEMLGMNRREVMQRLGTECMRNGMHNDFWIILVKFGIMNGSYDGKYGIIPDCRFLNELRICDYTIRINGDTSITGPSHISEQEWGEWDNWSVVIENHIDKSVSMNENKKRLFEKLDVVVSEILDMDLIDA